MRVITVRQPWAGAIIWRGKDIENRSRNIAGSYRGPVAIHVGLRHAYEAVDAHNAVAGHLDQHSIYGYGHIIGVVDLVSVHHDSDHGRGEADRCSPWAMSDFWHLTVANPLPLANPIPATGKLGLWKPDAYLAEKIRGAALHPIGAKRQS